MQPSGNSG